MLSTHAPIFDPNFCLRVTRFIHARELEFVKKYLSKCCRLR